MVCIACARPGWPLCGECERGLVVTHDRVLNGSVVGVPFLHTATAVRLVHNLKYRRSRAAGLLLAERMAERVPSNATSLVPVRRSFARRIKFGVDQATFLAAAVAAIVDVPVCDVLRAPVWWSQRAGAPRSERKSISFSSTRAIPEGAVLVDDVFTTGSTLSSAASAIGLATYSFLVATAAGSMSSGAEAVPNLGGDVTVRRRTRFDRPEAAPPYSPSAPHQRQRVQRAHSEVRHRKEHG